MPQPKRLNPYYRPAWEASQRYRKIFGGAGSGKSVYTAQEEVRRAGSNGEHNILLVRKMKTDLRDSCYALVKKVLGTWGWLSTVKIRRNEFRFTFQNGAQILGVGLDDRQRLKSIVDPTRVWVEEANQITEEDFNELNRRLRGETDLNYQITLTFNPEMGRDHWIRRRWFEDGKPAGEKKTYRKEIETEEGEGVIEMPYWEEGRSFWMRTTHEHNPWSDEEYGEILREGGKKAAEVYARGKFHDSDEPDQLIQSEWVERAFKKGLDNGEPALGVDVARFGDDDTALLVYEDPVVTYAETHSDRRTTDTAGRVKTLAERFEISEERVVVDTGGLGAGTADSLHEDGFNFTPVKYGSNPIEDGTYRDSFFEFQDLRSQMWWHLRKLFMRREIAIDLDPDSKKALRLRKDLTAPRYDIKQGKTIKVEPKEGRGDSWGVKSRLGRSPDEGDALIQAAFASRLNESKSGGGAVIGKRGETSDRSLSLAGKR